MKMAHIKNKLAAYLDDELDSRTRAQVEEHLSTCHQCRQELQEIRLGALYAQKRPMFTPSDQVWENLERKLIATENTRAGQSGRIRKRSYKRILNFSYAFGVALVLVMGWWWFKPETSFEPVQIDLDQYLSVLEAQPEDRFPKAFARLPSGFQRVDAAIAARAAGIEQAGVQIPVPDFELVSCRMRQIGGDQVIQFLYGKSGQAFVVFVAPKSVKFNFAEREIAAATVKELSGGTIDSDRLATFWTGGGDFQTLLVSRLSDSDLTAAIIRHFVTAHKESKR